MLKLIKKIFEFLPSNAPEFIYTTIFKPKPIQSLVNWVILKIIPESILLPTGRILFFNKKDPVVSGALALGVYEGFETSLFQAELKAGMTVVDIGANIGYYTVIAANAVGQTGKVIAFEPDKQSADILQKNIKTNKFNNISFINKAVSNTIGLLHLYVSNKNRGDNRIYDPGDGRQYVEVEVTTLDHTISPETRIDIIKMDIQGAEALALDGMEESIKRSKKITFFTEFWPESIKNTGRSPEEFLKKLISLGFTLYYINDEQKQLEEINDINKFANRFKGREYANLACYKK